MNKSYGIILFALILSSFLTLKDREKVFKILGTIKNYKDGTFLYLADLSDGSYKDIDSTTVFNERFTFQGELKNDIVRMAIHTKDFKDRVSFWIDSSVTVISAENGNIRNAAIKGSKAQEKKFELDSIVSHTKNEKGDYIMFIQRNPTSIVSADLLKVYASTWNKDTVSMLYKSLAVDVKNSIYGKRIFDFLSLNKDLKIGDRYANFEQATMDGKNIKLSDYKGKTVLLEFWGSWCGPCREGHPKLIEIYNQFKDKGFDILGVAADTDKKLLLNAIKQDQLPWQNVSDLKGDQNKVALIYGISAYPTNFLIDKDGIIVAKNLRDQKLFNKLSELLK